MIYYYIPDMSVVQDVKDRSGRRDPLADQGYNRPGVEILDRHREEEQQEATGVGPQVASMELRETFDVGCLGAEGKFPDAEAPSLRPAFTSIGHSLIGLGLRLLGALALHLHLDRDFFAERHKGMMTRANTSRLRAINYPAIEGKNGLGLQAWERSRKS